MKSVRSLGIEIELFLQKPDREDETVIYHAYSELNKLFGFSLDQNYQRNDYGSYLCLYHCPTEHIQLQTDGTPIEIQALLDYREIAAIPNYVLLTFLKTVRSRIKALNAGLLNKYQFSSACYQQSSPNSPCYAQFINPGQVFSSEKTIRDAYSGRNSTQEKKDSNDEVTERTLGLHLHFGLPQNQITDVKLTDRIVRNLDSILENEFRVADLGDGARQREANYQKKGIYRLKKHPDNFTTLEYRQLTPAFFLDKDMLYRFLLLADAEICRILNIST